MKTPLLITASIVLISSFVSCGPSAAERELGLIQSKLRRDSLYQVAEQIGDSAEAIRNLRLMSIAELEAAQVTLERTKNWRFGRSLAQRDFQIKQASVAVQNLVEKIQWCESQEMYYTQERTRQIEIADYLHEWSTALYSE